MRSDDDLDNLNKRLFSLEIPHFSSIDDFNFNSYA